MTIDDPFAEPDDSERTVIRPNPGGRRPAEPAPAAMPYSPPPMPGAGIAAGKPLEVLPLKGLNPLVNAALPMLDLVVQIKNRAVHNNVESLRDRVVAEINAFERRITPLGLSLQTI